MKAYSVHFMGVSLAERNAALAAVRQALWDQREAIEKENREDLRKAREDDLPKPLLERLLFDEKKILAAMEGIQELVDLPDPLGRQLLHRQLDEGLILERISRPIGVIGVIFESRPDSLVQIAALCLKSGNCTLMKGGSEAALTNRILYEVIAKAVESSGLSPRFIALLEHRSQIDSLLACHDEVDLLIPRGSNEFVSYVMDHTQIPVMGHASGVCHIYADARADLDLALPVIIDAKIQYAVACNAVETLLVHAGIAHALLPRLAEEAKRLGIELRGDDRTLRLIPCTKALASDYGREFSDLILAIKIVDDMEEAVDHINRYGSGHTDAILTEDAAAAERFLEGVDSSSVMHNCSTRFADGFRYGFGAEVGISTGKLHARGPVGLEGLTTYNYLIRGKGQVVADYSQGRKQFHFQDL